MYVHVCIIHVFPPSLSHCAGIGQIVLQVAAKIGCKCYGLEKADIPAKFAEVIEFWGNSVSLGICAAMYNMYIVLYMYDT